MNQKGSWAGLLLVMGIVLFPGPSYALNYFELEVYPYRTAAQGEMEVENFTTYSRRGMKAVPETEASKGITRNTLELAYGVTDKTEVAVYHDDARPRDGAWESKANRLRARTHFLEKGALPVDLGLYAELSLPRNEENVAELELRAILEQDFGRWTVDLNPIIEKVIKGADKSEAWEFQYAGSLIYRLNERWHPRLDLFGDFGPANNFEGRHDQKHLISPAVDIRLQHGLSLGLGVAYGLTDATEKQLVRARLEWEF